MSNTESTENAAKQMEVNHEAKELEDKKKKKQNQKEFQKKEKAFRDKKKKQEDEHKLKAGTIEEMPAEKPNMVAVRDETTTAIALPPKKLPPSQALLDKCDEAMETIEEIGDDLKLPTIRLTNDGFEMSKGTEPIESFDGVLLFNKSSNVYYEGKYKAGDSKPPICMSSNGNFPDVDALPEGVKPQFANCKKCPKNQWKSDPAGGDGKACKNTKPLFILLKPVDEDEDGVQISVIPKVLRVPPTSIQMLNDYIIDVGGAVGSLRHVQTTFSLYKKDENQPYFNIRFSKTSGKFPEQVRSDINHIRNEWIGYMRDGMFGLDVELEDEPNEKVVSAQPTSGKIAY